MGIERHKRRGTPQRGFTLIELMVTMTVAAVLLGLAAPSVSRLIANNRITSQTNEFVGGLNLARAEAVRQGRGVTLRADTAGIDFAPGWTVYKDPSAAAADPAATTDVIRHATASNTKTTLRRVTLSGSTYTDATSSVTDRRYVAFNARGGNNAGGSAFFRVCDSTNTALPGRIVQVAAVGRVSLVTAAAVCS
jgi:type IV fimbrial biogenesis protein FimT